jgi:hypothetical protein
VLVVEANYMSQFMKDERVGYTQRCKGHDRPSYHWVTTHIGVATRK